MKSKIVYLPLDERPCNYIYPQYIAEIGGESCIVPPQALMGNFKQSAQCDALWDWLYNESADASCVIISADMLVYGGIVPSRLHHLTPFECAERLNRIQELKTAYPTLIIYAFGLITRAPARNGSGEEPDYYEEHGYDIHRYGVITEMQALGVDTVAEQRELSGIKQRVPDEFLCDFIERRQTNYISLLRLVDFAANGVIDHLIIPLDDCKEYGYAPTERKRLAKYMAQKNMLSKIAMYPGADEIGCTLIARAVCHESGVTPSIWLDYTSDVGKFAIPAYEDRSICETAPHHVLNAGAELALSCGECDAALFINPPTSLSARLEKELDRREIYLESERNLSAFLNRAKQMLCRDTPCFIADCATANGADKCLMQFLYEQNMLNSFTGYSGWNTSSNAMGTVMAHAVAYVSAQKSGRLTERAKAVSDEFRLYRYLEDWGYMIEIRKTLTERLDEFCSGLTFLDLQDKSSLVSEEATVMLQRFAKFYFPKCGFTPSVTMPWNRLFEVNLILEFHD